MPLRVGGRCPEARTREDHREHGRKARRCGSVRKRMAGAPKSVHRSVISSACAGSTGGPCQSTRDAAQRRGNHQRPTFNPHEHDQPRCALVSAHSEFIAGGDDLSPRPARRRGSCARLETALIRSRVCSAPLHFRRWRWPELGAARRAARRDLDFRARLDARFPGRARIRARSARTEAAVDVSLGLPLAYRLRAHLRSCACCCCC